MSTPLRIGNAVCDAGLARVEVRGDRLFFVVALGATGLHAEALIAEDVETALLELLTARRTAGTTSTTT